MLMAIFSLVELMNLKQRKRQEEKRYKLFYANKKGKMTSAKHVTVCL